MDYKDDNKMIYNVINNYLSKNRHEITKEQIDNVMKAGVSENYAYNLLLLNYLELDEEYLDKYLTQMVEKEDVDRYANDPFLKRISNIKINNKSKIKLDFDYIDPYQLYESNSPVYYLDGRAFPQLGYFDDELKYPVVDWYEKRLLRVSPFEINTMQWEIDNAKGKVLCAGLGLGYFAYMVSLKKDVESVTIVEKNKDIINLFNEYILPLFDNKEKIKIINDNPLKYLTNLKGKKNIDYLFIYPWDSPSRGKQEYKSYLELKNKFNDGVFSYWLEDIMINESGKK